MSGKYDWETAQQLFVEGVPGEKETDPPTYLNLRELAEQLEIPYQQVRERASKNRWRQLRSQAQLQFAAKIRSDRVRKMADEALKFDDGSLSIAKMGMALVRTRLGEIGQHVEAQQEKRKRTLERVRNGDIVDYKELFSAVNYKEIQGLAIAASAFNDLGQKAMGTDAINVNVQGGIDVSGTVDHQVSVSEELGRPDPERMGLLLSILTRSQVSPETMLGMEDDDLMIEGTAEELPETVEVGNE